MTDTDTVVSGDEATETDLPRMRDDRLTIEIGPYGSFDANPCELWSDPKDSPGSEVQSAIRLLRSVRLEGVPDVPPEFR